MVSGRFMAGRRGGAVPTVVLAAVLATAIAACSSSSSSGSPASSATSGTATPSGTAAASSASPATTAKVTGAAATALITKAIANTKAAPSLTVVGSGVSTGGSSSQRVSFDLTLVQKAGCRGTIALSKTQTFQLVETGGYVWLKPSSAYYTSLHISKAALALVADKYIKVPSSNSNVTDLSKICSFSGLFGELPTPTGTSYVATPTTYQGQSAYQVTQSGQPGYLYIVNSSKPVLAKLAEPTASGGVITFSEYNVPLEVTAPSDAESIDGTKLGL
jgi:hypothetical protein